MATKATDSELADDIISASLAELELREKIGLTRFELFKQVQSEGLDRAGEEFRHKYRALLEVKDEKPAERYDRLRTKVAQIARELYAKLLREIAANEVRRRVRRLLRRHHRSHAADTAGITRSRRLISFLKNVLQHVDDLARIRAFELDELALHLSRGGVGLINDLDQLANHIGTFRHEQTG